MISGTISIRPRYDEVDQMGYIYHANYVSYCHQSRTELMRSLDICDAFLEANNIMMPVVSFDINYKQPSGYDELINVIATIEKIPDVKLSFRFEIKNKHNKLIANAHSIVVFVNAKTRKPMRAPAWLLEKFKESLSLKHV